jgi:hypothetical protein
MPSHSERGAKALLYQLQESRLYNTDDDVGGNGSTRTGQQDADNEAGNTM